MVLQVIMMVVPKANSAVFLSHREVWVQSSKPYPISLTLKQIQGLLQVNQGIDTDCFNMAVRANATDIIQSFNPCHFMDLQFCVSFYVNSSSYMNKCKAVS